MTETTRILVLGSGGQLGMELSSLVWPAGTTLDRPTRQELNVANSADVASFVGRGSYAAIINCAAWTAVDLAESEIEKAWQANALGPLNLALASARAEIPILHISTDYVFSGDLDRPYCEDDPTAPRSVYGASKLAGEWAVLTTNKRSVVLRTAWVLSQFGSNFAKTMLRLGKDRNHVSVVADQRGCPTSAADIAAAVRDIVLQQINDANAPSGIFHFVNTGDATWAELARFVFDCAAQRGEAPVAVTEITSEDYPTAAKRPRNSRLNVEAIGQAYGIRPRSWQQAVEEVVEKLVVRNKGQG